MTDRTHDKDHLAELSKPPTLVPAPALVPTANDNLQFWTGHETENYLVDLNEFKNGRQEKSGGGNWLGPFRGRPELISELAPAIEELWLGSTELTAKTLCTQLRQWWRLLDRLEADLHEEGDRSLRSVSQLTEIHRQRAFDSGMDRTAFRTLLNAANLTRRAMRLPELYWKAPEGNEPRRHLAAEWQVKEIRRGVRSEWFSVVDRWAEADALLVKDPGGTAERQLLGLNYRYFRDAVKRTSLGYPRAEKLLAGKKLFEFNRAGLSLDIMIAGFYPTAWDIRAALHQCLASTGWNASTLLDIDVSTSYIVDHPKDPLRYFMTGTKVRGNTEQTHVGLWKTQGAAGFILTTLVKRTDALRNQLREELTTHESEYAEAFKSDVEGSELAEKFRKIQALRAGIRSPWLYVSRAGIHWLDKLNFSNMGKNVKGQTRTFLGDIIRSINEKADLSRQINSDFVPSDFRDAFAAYVWRASGGSILHVMKALGHRSLRNTTKYMDNTQLREKSQQLYRTFSNAMWHEIKVHKRLDPTIVAKASRDGPVTADERGRLKDYRNLRMSRLNIGCKNPHSPPRHVAPNFVSNGRRICPTQRCTLCFDHAVLFPESVNGICMRMEELIVIERNISTTAWVDSQYPEEFENTELALHLFDVSEVASLRRLWAARIESGEHRIPGLPFAASVKS